MQSPIKSRLGKFLFFAIIPIALIYQSAQSALTVATYNGTLKAPMCAVASTGCDAPTLNGRGTTIIGVEQNAPNTIYNSCIDGNVGTYHSDESLDRLTITSLDGGVLTGGKQARIDATIWAYSSYTGDKLNLYYTSNASSPTWTYIGSIIPTKAGAQVLSSTFTLSSSTSSLQAIRGSFIYGTTVSPCISGGFNDQDDLVFFVNPTTVTVTSPIVHINNPVQGLTYSGRFNANGTATASSGLKSMGIKIDSNPETNLASVTSWITQIDTYLIVDGTHTLTIRATDYLNQVGTDSVQFKVNNTAVPITISSPSFLSNTVNSAQFYWYTSKPCLTKVDYGTTSAYGLTVQVSTQLTEAHVSKLVGLDADAPYYFRLTATDAYGNSAQSAQFYYRLPDYSMPVVYVTTPTSNQILGPGQVSISGTASDNRGVLNVLISVDGKNLTPVVGTTNWSVNFNCDSVLTSSHVVSVSVNDTANNQKSVSVPFYTKINISSVNISNIEYNTALFSWYTNALATTEVLIGTSTSSMGIFFATTTLINSHLANVQYLSPDKVYYYQVRSRDYFGQITTSGIGQFSTKSSFIPSIKILSPRSGDSVPGIVTISGTAFDFAGVASVEVKIGSMFGYYTATGTTSWTFKWDTRLLPMGTYTVLARVTNINGYSSNDSWVTVTLAPPSIASVTVQNISNSSATFSWTTIVPSNTGIFYSETPIYTASSILGWTLPELTTSHVFMAPGLKDSTTYYFIVSSIDGLGHEIHSAMSTFMTASKIDVSSPTVHIFSPLNGQILSGSIYIGGNSSDDSRLSETQIFVDTQLVQLFGPTNNWSFSLSSSCCTDGIHEIKAKTIDLSGKSGSDSVFIKIDNTAPTIQIATPTQNQTLAGLVLITGTVSDASGLSNIRLVIDSTTLNVLSLSSGTLTMPYSFNLFTTSFANGTHDLKIYANDVAWNFAANGVGNEGVKQIQIVINNPVISTNAVYDASLKAPTCLNSTNKSSCDSETLLVGRGSISNGIELNKPNSINNSCSDGNSGVFHSDESIDRIKVSSLNGLPLAQGQGAKIETSVYAYSAASDYLHLYISTNALNPTWQFLKTIKPTASGFQVLTTTYTLPSGSYQAIRAAFVYANSVPASCTVGVYDDHDDLAFSVASSSTSSASLKSVAPSNQVGMAAPSLPPVSSGSPSTVPFVSAAVISSPAFFFGEVYSFPNPAKFGKNPTVHIECALADAVELTVFDVSGNAVHSVILSNESQQMINGKSAFEYTWDAQDVVSGVYSVVIVAKKEGSAPIKINRQIVIIK